MEVSEVRRRLLQAIDRARRTAALRRTRADEATRQFDGFLDRIAVPIFRQVAAALKAEGYPFAVFTPGGAVRLMSERGQQDFIELTLDTSGDLPLVLGRVSRGRGRHIIDRERPVAARPVGELTEEDVLEFLLAEIEPFVER